ncbi:MAG: von Willebrand factor type A domain-containing protein [Clostridia bacterium]|nr:von Willebrand factor type A domain-containing protein [Clostridia bacterium]
MMKRMQKLLTALLVLCLVLSFVGCGAGGEESDALVGNNYFSNLSKDENNLMGDVEGDLAMDAADDAFWEAETGDNANGGDKKYDEEVEKFIENAFIETAKQNVSTLSADVDTASYTYFRKLINDGGMWEYLARDPYAFRTEEFINYFDYTDAKQPDAEKLFGVSSSIFPCPWNKESVLLRATLQAAEAPPVAGNNLVFLIDVSGSMMSADKLPLLQKAFGYLVDQLGETDIISIVTYSGREQVVLRGCEGTRKVEILEAINSLTASGSTNGQAGLQEAYRIATENFIEGGNNRIIMASDGDLNVGISSAEELKNYVSEQREKDIYLSVLGFGMGNYRDANMEALADNGNGVYYYIDGESEAEKVFCTDLLGTLYTVAEDVKLQISFDKELVSSYRLIGYENRLLSEEDFTDDTKDAGEVGSGHTVTVCYELKLNDGAMIEGASWLELAVNYKYPGENTSVDPERYTIGYADYSDTLSEDAKFLVCVIETCMLIHDSDYLSEDFDLSQVIATLDTMLLDNDPARAEFAALLKKLNGPKQ